MSDVSNVCTTDSMVSVLDVLCAVPSSGPSVPEPSNVSISTVSASCSIIGGSYGPPGAGVVAVGGGDCYENAGTIDTVYGRCCR